MDENEEKKRLYDETASLIADLGMRDRITIQEMRFLLTLLDQVVVKRQYPELIHLLQDWMNRPPDGEVDQIIKETLVNIDFSEKELVRINRAIIAELLDIRGGDDSV